MINRGIIFYTFDNYHSGYQNYNIYTAVYIEDRTWSMLTLRPSYGKGKYRRDFLTWREMSVKVLDYFLLMLSVEQWSTRLTSIFWARVRFPEEQLSNV